MTESTTEEVGELASEYTPPFLRITATYPVGKDDDRVEIVTLEMNLGDGDDLGEYEADDPTAVKTWVTDVITSAIDALRRRQIPAVVRLDGIAQKLLAEQVRHAEDCACGVAPAGGPPTEGTDQEGEV